MGSSQPPGLELHSTGEGFADGDLLRCLRLWKGVRALVEWPTSGDTAARYGAPGANSGIGGHWQEPCLLKFQGVEIRQIISGCRIRLRFEECQFCLMHREGSWCLVGSRQRD